MFVILIEKPKNVRRLLFNKPTLSSVSLGNIPSAFPNFNIKEENYEYSFQSNKLKPEFEVKKELDNHFMNYKNSEFKNNEKETNLTKRSYTQMDINYHFDKYLFKILLINF